MTERETKLILKSTSADKTIKLGEAIGSLLSAGDVVVLIGELGAGKTTLVKGIARGIGVEDKRVVKSPTFSLVNKYEGYVPVYHFDAYRLEDTREMLDIGSDEILFGDGVSIIEWGDKVAGCLPEEYLRITLAAISENERNIEIYGYGDRYGEIINRIKSEVMGR